VKEMEAKRKPFRRVLNLMNQMESNFRHTPTFIYLTQEPNPLEELQAMGLPTLGKPQPSTISLDDRPFCYESLVDACHYSISKMLKAFS